MSDRQKAAAVHGILSFSVRGAARGRPLNSTKEACVMKQIEIAAIGEPDYASWDSFVTASDNGTLFHKSYWLNASGRPFDLWGAYRSSNLVGGYVASRKSVLGLPMAGAPFMTFYSGFVVKKPEGSLVHQISFQQEVASAFARFLPEKYSWGISLFSPGVDCMLPFIWDDFIVRPWYTYRLDITDLDKVWEGLHQQRRQAIRGARAAGVRVLTDVAADKVVAVVRQTYDRQGLRFKAGEARAYLAELQKRKQCRMFLSVDKEGRELAAICAVWDERRVYALMGGFSDDHNGGASPLAWWEMIRFASEELGLKELDTQGTQLPRLEAFQRKYGCRLTPHYEIRWGKAIGTLVGINRFLSHLMVLI